MSDVIQFTPKPRYTDYFGGCPKCWRCDDILNVGKSHIAVCHAHKVQWSIGMNLFSSWRHETEEDWMRNADLLSGYQEVEPVHHPEPVEAQEQAKVSTELGCKIGDTNIHFSHRAPDFLKELVFDAITEAQRRADAGEPSQDDDPDSIPF